MLYYTTEKNNKCNLLIQNQTNTKCANPDWIIGTPGPGGRLNKKDGLTRYGDSHVKDKTS